jgi:hypothetical protein
MLVLLAFSGCKSRTTDSNYDAQRPRRPVREYFDKKYLLYQLPANYYHNTHLDQSFIDPQAKNLSGFKPFGYDTALNLEYEHIYSKQCVYKNDTNWKYAQVCFPNTCLTHEPIYATVTIKNTTSKNQTYALRVFYQNTTYWFRTDDSINLAHHKDIDNFYGMSAVVQVNLPPGADSLVRIPYTIDMNPKSEDPGWDDTKVPSRAGNYEFLVLALPASDDNFLMRRWVDLKDINPFAVIKEDQLKDKGKTYGGHFAYTGPHHFKFVFMNEYFDGTDDLAPGHLFVPKNGREKRLCDTCSGWYHAVISESWRPQDFFTGYIFKSPYVKADYGIRKENCSIDTSGITLTIPKSTRGNYKKTWGELLIGQAFKYGHLTIRAKFAPMVNKSGTPNGIVHNMWLYQRDADAVDTSNPYSYLRNSEGKQPFEIDFEFWTSEDKVKSPWDDKAFINYSIVDYMRDASVNVKPGDIKTEDNYQVNRFNNRQLNVPGEGLPPAYFDSFHTYELYWYPDYVRFLVDGIEKAYISGEEAKIPDKHLFLWIGSPLYQDGTYYNQSSIPFLKEDKKTIIDYIKIE